MRGRLLGGKLEKAHQGQLRFRLPVGLVYDPAGQATLDPDQQVQQAVRLLFDLFDQSGSALAVVKHFATHHLLFPDRSWRRAQDAELSWNPLRSSRVLAVLYNPAYAGAYVYGRTRTRTQTLPGEAPRLKGRTRRVAPEDWTVVLYDARPSYIPWDQFLRNQQRLEDNRTFHPEDHRGAVREGAALLQGIVLCGRCGRRMSVRYLHNGAIPSYECSELHAQLAAATCQSIRGDAVDAAVAQVLLDALQPAQLQVSLAALDQMEARARLIDRQWQLRLERARYEADLARRRLFAVEPENRLVARTLERDWNEKLADIERQEQEYAALPRLSAHLATPEERQRILDLAQDLPAVWHAPTTTHAHRKQLLRFLVKDVTLARSEATIHVGIRWQTDALTSLEIPRPKKSYEARRTSPAVVDRVRQLALLHANGQIAETLNKEGFISGTGRPFTGSIVQWIRWANSIPTGCPAGPAACPTGQRRDGRYSARATATLLNVNVSTIADWCKSGRLDGIQTVPHGPRWITLPPEIIAELRKPRQQRWSCHSPE